MANLETEEIGGQKSQSVKKSVADQQAML